jgi:hypothetical protein
MGRSKKKFSGLTAEPTTQPLVQHSDPGYPLGRAAGQLNKVSQFALLVIQKQTSAQTHLKDDEELCTLGRRRITEQRFGGAG